MVFESQDMRQIEEACRVALSVFVWGHMWDMRMDNKYKLVLLGSWWMVDE